MESPAEQLAEGTPLLRGLQEPGQEDRRDRGASHHPGRDRSGICREGAADVQPYEPEESLQGMSSQCPQEPEDMEQRSGETEADGKV